MTATAPSRSAISPSSSPRLPSPPPIPEVQYGPLSPSLGSPSSELQLDAPTKPDEGAARRIRPGTKAADMAVGPPLVPLHQLDSPFQLQEHLKALYASLTHTSEGTHTIPITKETARRIANPPHISETETVDKNLWLYELCRFLVLKANLISCALMIDTPPCSAITCPEMRASEWQYLCAVHEPPKSCCAIDYCNHTLDWAANVLTSPKHFPSRLTLGGEGGNVFQSMRQLTNIFRRVYRIFAHAWFQHQEVFWSVEATYGIYIFFKTVCDEYQLIPEDNYTIPREAEGSREEDGIPADADYSSKPQILRKDNPELSQENGHESIDNVSGTLLTTGATTRRHKHTPSTGSHVAPIAEGHEEEEEGTTTAGKSVPASLNAKGISPERALQEGLTRLDISRATPYEPTAPEDPTPTTRDRPDPLAEAGRSNLHFEEEVTSPSGGSVRTGGPDVLNAILGHIQDYDDTPADKSDTETAIAIEEESTHDEDENETMERIDIPISKTSNEVPEQSKEEHAGLATQETTESDSKAEEEKDGKTTSNDENEKTEDDLTETHEENEATATPA